MKCKVCKKVFDSNRSLAFHVKAHGLTSREYYDEYIKKTGEGECSICGDETSFRSGRYLQTCSASCKLHQRIKDGFTGTAGTKQSADTIANRVAKTDQTAKEKTRRKTLMAKYGTLTLKGSMSEETFKERALKISRAHKGRVHTEEHHKNVIDSKRRNGTLMMSAESRKKISASLKKTFGHPDFDKSVFINGNKRHETGWVDGVLYRSSYEKAFLKFCKRYDVEVESAETKAFSVKYKDREGEKRDYFPDFYLPEHDLIVEVKPRSMLRVGENPNKFKAMRKHAKHDFLVVTEDHGLLNKKEWKTLYEHICS